MASGSSQTTTDHNTIKKWVEERGGSPASVKGTGEGDEAGVLRIDFPGYSGEDTLEHVSWDKWFEAFEEDGLAFLHQDHLEGNKESRFSKLVSRNSEEVMELARKQQKS